MAIIFDVVNANHTVSNAGLTVTNNVSSAWSASRSSTTTASGKVYWEVKVELSSTNTYAIIGACVAPITTFPGQSGASSWGYNGYNGQKFYNGTGASYGSAVAKGDIISVAVDLGAGKIWFAKNGVWQASGDPATGANPTFTGISGNLAPAVGLYTSGNSVSGRFTSSSLTYSPPSGFSALDTESVATLMATVDVAEELDTVEAVTVAPSVASIAIAEELDAIVSEAASDTLFVSVEDQIDDVSVSCSIGVATLYCTFQAREYKDTVAISAYASGSPAGVFFISESIDTVSATASTPNVFSVGVDSGDIVFAEASTPETIVSAIFTKDPIDTVGVSCAVGSGSTISAVSAADDVVLFCSSATTCLIDVDDGLDLSRIVTNAPSLGAFSFSYQTRTRGTVDGPALSPLHFQR